ncbi:MAG: oligosaccharide flippase family protein [Gemmatimonadota bacterium]
MTRPTLTNLVYLGTGEVLTRGLSFVAFAYLGRTLSTGQFGVLGTALAVLMVGTLVIDFGFGILGSREIAKDGGVTESLTRRIVSLQLTLAIVASLALFGGTWIVPMDGTLAALLRGFSLSLLGVPFLLNWVFQGRNEMFWFAAPAVLRQALFLVLVLILVRGTEGLGILPAAEIGAIAGSGAAFVWAYRRLGFRLRFRPVWDRTLWATCLPIGLSNLIWAIRMYLPVVVVYSMVGAEPAGLFESAHRLAMVFLAILGVYFTNLFPAMSATSHRSPSAFKRLLARGLATAVAGTLALLLITWQLAPTMIELVFGPRYVTPESTWTLIVLTMLVPIAAFRRMGRFALIALDHQRRELWCSIVGVVSLVVLLAILPTRHGISGAAWAMVGSESVGAILTWMALAPLLGTPGARNE